MTRFAVFAVAIGFALPVVAPVQARPLTQADLQEALAQRDQQIATLERRIAALEAERGPVATSATAAEAAQAPAPAATAAASGGNPDDETALQALSRGLVQRGLLLLPPWSVEVAPSFTYAHSQQQGLVLVDTPEGISTVDSQRQRDDSLEGAVSARIGLPWRSQLQLSVPVDWKRDVSALGDGTEVAHSQAHLGDIQLELSHQFMVEGGGLPDIIAAVAWRAPTGQDPYRAPAFSVANGLGTNQVTGRITALKTIDPMVVFSSLSYSANFPYNESFGRVRAGDTADWQLGALLAVSPDTSLSFGFDQEFKSVTRVNGAKIAGSDGVAAVAQFGLDQVINSRTVIDISLGIGVTKDAPDYQLMVSVPIRFR